MQQSPSVEAKKEFAKALWSAIKGKYKGSKISEEIVELSISVPKSEQGDLSSSLSFRLAQELKRRPHEIGTEILSRCKPGNLIRKFSELNGYINAELDTKKYSELVLNSLMKEKGSYGKSDIGKGKKALIESPSLNPNKPVLVSHLRNAILGNVISNLYSFCSYNVERENYIDDLGLQMTESVWGYLNLSKEPDKRIDHWLGEQYVEVNKTITEKKLEKEIGELAKKIEHHGTKEAKVARELAEKCVYAQYQTLYDYNISHDVLIWESDIVKADLLEKALKYVKQKGAVETPKEGKYANCLVVKLNSDSKFSKDFEGSLEGTKVLVRSNGTATYAAKDLAFHMWKFGLISGDFGYSTFIKKQADGKPLYTSGGEGKGMDFGKSNIIINVIAAQQRYEQLVLKLVFDLAGHKQIADNMIHLAYGFVNLEGGSLSTRKGGWMGEDRSYTADELLKEAEAKIATMAMLAKVNRSTVSKETIRNIALAAIKFEYLKIAPEKEISFSWEKALNFEANSGPYCMYTFSRANSILEKVKKEIKISSADIEKVSKGEDFSLIKMLGAFPETVEKACNESRPNVLADYLLELSSAFSKFYEKMPILKGEEAMPVRVHITMALKQVMKTGLQLLGIIPVESM